MLAKPASAAKAFDAHQPAPAGPILETQTSAIVVKRVVMLDDATAAVVRSGSDERWRIQRAAGRCRTAAVGRSAGGHTQVLADHHSLFPFNINSKNFPIRERDALLQE